MGEFICYAVKERKPSGFDARFRRAQYVPDPELSGGSRLLHSGGSGAPS
jgi:hypothetical protein